MPRTTRRQALVTVAVASTIYAQQQPSTLSARRYEALAAALDQIIPASDTPGALGAGVPALVDYDAARQDWRAQLEGALELLVEDGFLDANAFGKEGILTGYMNDAEERGDAFRLLKELAVDYYYSTEVGLADELGYQGGTYLAEFDGCTHPEHQDSGR